MITAQAMAADFERWTGLQGAVYRAPGRVNLIGEHTDYNDGFVMPMAIAQSAWVAAARRPGRIVRARSVDLDETVTIDLDRLPPPRRGHWSDYVAGVCAVLDRQVRLAGGELLIRTDVPIGAGLSSSAALETACGVALLAVADASLDRTTLARAAQRAEHEYAGIHCGLMDQFIASHGRAGHALLLDIRTLAEEWLRIPDGLSVLACNTMVRHSLASAAYNDRRADCEAGVRLLARDMPGVAALRDVTLPALESARHALPERVYQRCLHVVTENARVLDAARALRAGDRAAIGSLMAASHSSLRFDYEVSCPELDLMVDIATATEGVVGARMTGGGFGGCVVAMVEAERVDSIRERIAAGYEQSTGVRPDIWTCEAADGAGRAADSDSAPLS